MEIWMSPGNKIYIANTEKKDGIMYSAEKKDITDDAIQLVFEYMNSDSEDGVCTYVIEGMGTLTFKKE